MAGINKVILVGNLGAKPEIKYASNGNAVSNLSIATSESWTDKTTGEKQERTEWHRVSLFGKLAEIAAQYTDKGSKVYVEGKLETRNILTMLVSKNTLQALLSVALMECFKCLIVEMIQAQIPLHRIHSQSLKKLLSLLLQLPL